MAARLSACVSQVLIFSVARDILFRPFHVERPSQASVCGGAVWVAPSRDGRSKRPCVATSLVPLVSEVGAWNSAGEGARPSWTSAGPPVASERLGGTGGERH